jgi:hypothetical protein
VYNTSAYSALILQPESHLASLVSRIGTKELKRRDLPYKESEPATDTHQDPCDHSPLYACTIVIIRVAEVVAPVVIRPSLSKDISSIYEDQDGKDKTYEKVDHDRNLEEDRKGR